MSGNDCGFQQYQKKIIGAENFIHVANGVSPTASRFWCAIIFQSRMDNQKSLIEIFMQEGQCARCGVNKPTIWKPFLESKKLPEVITELGFCSNKCLKRFVHGIADINKAVENITQ